MRVDLLSLAAAQTAQASQDPFWERFVLSPGFGGATALIAGVLAYLAANRKARYDREAARQKQWWDALAWVYDRGVVGQLSAELALDLLDRLRQEAQTDLELQTIAGLLTELFEDDSDAQQQEEPV